MCRFFRWESPASVNNDIHHQIAGDNDVSQLTALKPKLHKLEKKSQQGENGPLFEKHTFSEQKEKGKDGVFHDPANSNLILPNDIVYSG